MANKTSKMPRQEEYVVEKLEEEIKAYQEHINVLEQQITQCEIEIRRRKKLIEIQQDRERERVEIIEDGELANRLSGLLPGKNGDGPRQLTIPGLGRPDGR